MTADTLRVSVRLPPRYAIAYAFPRNAVEPFDGYYSGTSPADR
jgi:hypothetical protein